MYSIWWLPWIDRKLVYVIYGPTILLVVCFSIATFLFRRYPGGPIDKSITGETPWETWRGRQKGRKSEGELELDLARERETRKRLLAESDIDVDVRRIAYKEDAYADIDRLRQESNSYRRVNNTLQGFLIIGSLAATGVSGLAANLVILRWVTLGLTFLVGISSGFMGYFKYKERSFYLQQTADAIEQEWEAVEIGVGRYEHIDDETERLEKFVAEVHRLKSEQRKRQQNLEQPADSRDASD
ncbi:SLATT domain-containing protein [Actinoallomurus iriomotensis]|nr:SLATT domain-containing protein [Actinoallomurus iriomotensis]